MDGIGQAPRSKSFSPRSWKYPSSIEEVREAIYQPNNDVHFRSGKILPRRIAQSNQSASFERSFQWIEDWPEATAADRVAWAHRVVVQLVTSQQEAIEFTKRVGDFVKLLKQQRYKQGSEEHVHLKERPTPADVLRFYNAVVSRLKRFHVPVGRLVGFRGIRFAAEARSTAAMKHYLQASSELGKPLKRNPWISRLLSSVERWVETDPFAGWEGIRRRQGLLVLMCGWRESGIRGPHEIRQACIHDMIPTSLESIYLSILRRIANADALFDHWLHLQTSEPWEGSSPKGVPPLQPQVIEAFVQNLIQAGDPKRAWQVVEESGCRSNDLGESTWDALLEYPEYVGKWQDGMSERMLRKYEQNLGRIEESIGVRWSGGEDGFHLPASRI